MGHAFYAFFDAPTTQTSYRKSAVFKCFRAVGPSFGYTNWKYTKGKTVVAAPNGGDVPDRKFYIELCVRMAREELPDCYAGWLCSSDGRS